MQQIAILGGADDRYEFASILRTFGSEVTVIEMLDRLIPQEDDDAAEDARRPSVEKGIALELGKQCTAVEQSGSTLKVRYGDGGRSRST